MKTNQVLRNLRKSLSCSVLSTFLTVLAFGLCPNRVVADVNLNLEIWHGYDFYYPSLNLTASNPPPVTYHRVESPNGNIWKNFGTNNDSHPFFLTNNLAGLINECTNGLWKLFLNKQHTSETIYYFAVSMPGVTTNTLGDVKILFPLDGSTNITNQPTFHWTGPSNLLALDVSANHQSSGNSYAALLPSTATNWTPGILTDGANSFFVNYHSNNFPGITFTTPTNGLGATLPNWSAQGEIHTYLFSSFTVGTADTLGASHILVAHYPFDATNGPVLNAAVDTSGHGYNMTFGGSFGSQGGNNLTSNAMAGIGAVQFHNGNGNSAGYLGWKPMPANLLSALTGSFSISCWIKTSQNSFGGDTSFAFEGAGIVSADNSGLAKDVIPLALTGNKIGFNTGGDSQDVTLNSSAGVNDGNYHHIVVTRNRQTGQKIIYVDGQLDNFSSGSTNLLSDPRKLTIGAIADASDPNPNNFSYYNGYDGLLDDLQIYSGVLSSSEVENLFLNPGNTVSDKFSFDETLVARYDFEQTNSPGTDSSGNGNNANCGSGNGGTDDTFTTNSAVGSYARQYFGNTSICFPPNAPAFPNLSNAYRGSFSLSAWVKTTASVNADFANAYFGAPILFEYSSNTNSAIFSITGSKAAFTIGNPNGTDTTLHSTTSVNDGAYHFIAVTRNQTSGLMNVYVDGNLEATGASTAGPVIVTAGIDLAGGNNGNFNGLLDDVRIYSSELSADDVAILSGNTAGSLGTALNSPSLPWTTGGNANWFVETAVTHDNVSAAQSGAINNDQESWVQTSVAGPGTLSFWWKVSSEDGGDYLEFQIDGNFQTDITGNPGWQQLTYPIASGSHNLRWRYYKDGAFVDGLDAGFLDQVSFVNSTNTSPVITLNPFNQTNYPGYQVALLADGTGTPTNTWQWYKIGSGAVSGATNKLYIPTNSGTAAVAGNYFAIASNSSGTANTRTAAVTFVSAPLPPDWSRAFAPELNHSSDQRTTNYGIACLLDSAGNLYSANSFNGTNTFGSDTLISGPTRFATVLLKQTATGTAIWGRGITNSGNGNSFPQGLVPAPGNGVYMSGVFFGTNWLGTNQLVETAGASVYLARFDSNGSNLWVRIIGGTNAVFQGRHELVSDSAGNVTISALINNTTSFGTTNVTVDGQKGALAQYDANGTLRWVQVASGWFQYLTYSAGRIYGSMDGHETNFAGGATNFSDRRWVLVALNATNGQAAWLRGVGSHRDSSTLADDPQVAVSGTNVFLVGNGAGSNAVFGPFSVSWPEPVGQYFARYDTNGTAQLATNFGSATTLPFAVLADASGNVYVGGDFDTYSIFGNKIIAAPFYETIQQGIPGQGFVAKFDRNGNPLWARLAQSQSSYLNTRDLALASDGVWACGFFNDVAHFGTNTVFGTFTCIGTPFCSPEYHASGFLAKITDGAAAALPVTILNPARNGGNFTFQFLSQSGFTHFVESRTNAAIGAWNQRTNIAGDGSLKTIQLPATNLTADFFQVRTQ